MGNACSGCCSWVFSGGGQDAKRAKSGVLDEENTWFEQDSVPLVSARHDTDSIGSDSVVTKTVVMRSPRAAAASASHAPRKAASPRAPSTPSATASKSKAGAPSAHNTTTGDEAKVVKAPSRGLVCIDKSDDDDDDSRQQRSKRTESHDHRHTSHRSSAVASNTSSSSSVSSSAHAAPSHHSVGQLDASGADDGSTPRLLSRHEADDVDASEQNISSSSRGGGGDGTAASPSSAKGAKPPGSPKKQRYGRKNYRANSGRKKTE
ncbi:hypothetical protein PybrP1_006074 [[Pythium] brassicae (nom. inval.)]|nr:hypothetical protein PybrP1_006074 [[Pythium] brassicae (nom. inval.)]